MKRLAIISMLLVQLGLLFNKGFTVLHFFLHRAEIIEHFCHHATHEEEENCQGICYLKVEMSKEDNSPIKNFPVNSLVQDDVVYYEMPFVFSLEMPILKDENTPNFIVKTPVLYDNYLSIWRPPAVA
jgi:hypothetical protein